MTTTIDMFSGTGQLAYAVSTALMEPAHPVSFSDTYGPARKYLRERFPDAEVHSDFRDQPVPPGAVVTVGAPRQDLSVAGKRAGAERGSGTRSSLIHEALSKAVAARADLIIAENVPGGHSVYLSLADWLAKEYGYHTTVSSAGAWEVGAPHRRERIMLVAARRRFSTHFTRVVRQVRPTGLLPTPTASCSTGAGRSGRAGGTNLQTWVREGSIPDPKLIATWAGVVGELPPLAKDPEDRLNAAFVEWLMGLPSDNTVDLSRTARICLAGNAVVARQAHLMLQRGLSALSRI